MKILRTVIIILLFFAHRVNAQEPANVISTLAADYKTEKIYIHYDKEYYVAGETIWFKAYFYSNGKPSGLSNNFYLQFINDNGQLVSNKKYPVLGAVAKGSIIIPDSLPQGNYYIRAYTPFMLNYDEGLIYKKNIYVFHPGTSVPKSTTNETQTVSLKFFPESGYLVDGVITAVGFKAVDQFGTPVEINGVIKTTDGITIASFKSYHDGMGKVQFKPQAEKKYIAEVETEAGKRTYPLPEVSESGVSLKIQDEKGGKKFQLSRSEKGKSAFEKILLLVEINKNVVYENEIAFEDYPSVIGHLVTDSLPSGILHFTVFSSEGIPLAERLSFVNNGEYKSDVTLNTAGLNTQKRAANSFEVEFPQLIQRSCSVSITDLPQFSFNDDDNIVSRLLLTGDLKGYIHDPSWYFENHNDSSGVALDNLMLTQGWSRYDWKKLMANQFPEKKFHDENLISISGVVVDEKTKEPLSGGKLNIYLEAEDSTTQNFEANPDDNGAFRLDSLYFLGKAKLFYAYTDAKGKTRPALVIPDENGVDKNVWIVPGNISEMVNRKSLKAMTNKNEIDKRSEYVKIAKDEIIELENVNLKTKTNRKPIDDVNDEYTTGVFREMGKVNLDNVNDPVNDKSMNAIDYVKNRVPQLEIQSGRFVNRKNISLMTGQKWVVGIFLNEQPVEMNFLRTVRAKDIALVKFYEAGWVGVGSGSPGGAVAIYTKEKFVEEQKPEKLNYWEHNGYAITKQFYSPDYSKTDAKQPTIDNRTTLYWNPDLITDAETKSIKLDFFNNDFSKKFKVVIEGFDAKGKLIHLEKIVGD
ncbi:MAG TPA: hypothetical protein PKC72_09480 [Chitinophagaceae bacterium]|nr:hypothetical protein [Chitinophagaceae bacterium]